MYREDPNVGESKIDKKSDAVVRVYLATVDGKVRKKKAGQH